ncbi:MAG: hypothetical protein ACI97A_000380 [Planctomycetota bacterium]|jgi:hypothetical protein
MRTQKILSAMSLVVFGMVLMAATGSKSVARESRPNIMQEGVVAVAVDKVSGAVSPIRYLILKVDGPWLEVVLLKKKKRDRKGKSFWLRIDDLGAFVIES